jgi:hypothetical protein
LKNNTNVPINEVLFNPFILVSLIEVLKNPKIQMEHSHLIAEPNVTSYIYIFDWALYDNNISEILEVCRNLTIMQKHLNSATCFQILKKLDHKLWIT